MQFVRFGNLVPQEHNIYKGTYHTAPVKLGIYAFPKGYVEPFLLTGVGMGNIKNGRWKFVKGYDGKKLFASFNELFIDEKQSNFTERYKSLFKNIKPCQVKAYKLNEDDILEPYGIYYYNRDEKVFWVIENKRRIFNYNGNVWCHLMHDMKPFEIIRRSNEWVLVSIKTYEKALKTYINRYKFNHAKDMGKLVHTGDASGLPLDYLYLDMIEVFIEKIK